MKQSEIIKMAIKVFPMCDTILVVVPYLKNPTKTTALVEGHKIIIGRTFAGMKENGNIINPWGFVAVRTNNEDQPILWCYGRQNKKEMSA